ncbi:MAG: glycosyltransferase family 4 protein [Legionella sp.]|uniref:glycosyltransferase family 4 protein n=1 Tax=Legionella sp. TaxID=459 RepID=UPI00283B1BBF|nr:glycosyltransferase family 4 protein [Legionella sp.]
MSNHDLMTVHEMAKNAAGGTELIHRKLYDGRIPRELLQEFQIQFSRVSVPPDPTKIRVLVIQDLPGDPASNEALGNGAFEQFHRIVAVSNWQMQAYAAYYSIPYSRFVVLHNAIDPIINHSKPDDGIVRLIYTSTPHRGLNILAPVFAKLCEKYDNIELDVFSSFKIYGWEQRDEEFRQLFDFLEAHPKIRYHGAKPNEEVREALKRADIFAYPSIWQETSCIALIEAMSAGLLCVHSNLGALAETSSNWTVMYQYQEDINKHASMFYGMLDMAIETMNKNKKLGILDSQKAYMDTFYSWNRRTPEWMGLLTSLLNEPREVSEPKFVYKT